MSSDNRGSDNRGFTVIIIIECKINQCVDLANQKQKRKPTKRRDLALILMISKCKRVDLTGCVILQLVKEHVSAFINKLLTIFAISVQKEHAKKVQVLKAAVGATRGSVHRKSLSRHPDKKMS